MQFNQVNQNNGDVNNAVSGNGPVVQTVGNSGPMNNAVTGGGQAVQTAGDHGQTKVEQPKESFWKQAWAKLSGLWKMITG
jgi:hypothetical protein